MNRYYMEQLSQHADLLEESAEICNILHKNTNCILSPMVPALLSMEGFVSVR